MVHDPFASCHFSAGCFTMENQGTQNGCMHSLLLCFEPTDLKAALKVREGEGFNKVTLCVCMHI